MSCRSWNYIRFTKTKFKKSLHREYKEEIWYNHWWIHILCRRNIGRVSNVDLPTFPDNTFLGSNVRYDQKLRYVNNKIITPVGLDSCR